MGKHIPFWGFTTEDGLPESDEFPSLHEDRSGHIWAGGDGGLARFDGSRWTTVRTGNTWVMFDDGNGFLWVGVEEGLGRLDLRHWEFINRRHGLPGGSVTALTRDSKGHMLIGLGGDGMARYDGNRFERLDLPAQAGGVQKLFSDSKGRLWIGGDIKGQVYSGAVWNFSDGQWQECRNMDHVYAFGEDASGRVWGGGHWNFGMFEDLVFQQVQNRRVDGITRDRQGRLWFAGLGWDGQAKGGVHRFDGEGEDGFLKWTSFTATNGLPIGNAYTVFVDRKDRAWVGGWNEGVAR